MCPNSGLGTPGAVIILLAARLAASEPCWHIDSRVCFRFQQSPDAAVLTCQLPSASHMRECRQIAVACKAAQLHCHDLADAQARESS